MKWTTTFIAMAACALTAIASAGEIRPYTDQEFDRLTQQGKPVVLDVTAPWCPTCRAQKPIIESLVKLPAYRDVTVLTIDFDTAKPTLGQFKVAMQSTLVGFKGRKEVARSVGETSREGLERLFRRTVE